MILPLFWKAVADLGITKLITNNICPLTVRGKQSLLQRLVVSLVCRQLGNKQFSLYMSHCVSNVQALDLLLTSLHIRLCINILDMCIARSV